MSNPSKSTRFFYDKVDFLSTLSHTYDEELPKHINQIPQVENNNTAGDSDDDDFLPLQTPHKAATALPNNDAQPTGPASDLLKEYISLGYIDDSATNTEITQPRPPLPPLPAAAVLDQVPWLDSIQTITSPFLRLHQEIVQLCRYLQPSPQESKARQEAVDRVAEIVKCIWPTADVEVFGSYATNIYLPTSDIDAVVLRSGCTNIPKGLKALANLFLRRKAARNIQVIAKARVPIIKFEEEVSGYAFDISFDVANGPEAADNVRNMMAEIPPMRPLVMILKVFLHQRDLNEVYQGGLGSYALLVLMAAHLLAHPSRRSTGGNNIRRLQGSSSTISTDYAGEGNLGILLVDFFRLYGRALNPSVVGVSCRKGGGFFHKASTSGFNNPERSYLFAVEDPNDATNDLGRNSHNISRVRMAFDYAYCQLIAPSKQGTSLLKRIIRLDPVLFARDPSSHAIIEAPEGGGGGEGVKKRRRE